TQDWSPRITRAPTLEPANTIAPVEITVASPTPVGGSGSPPPLRRARAGGRWRLALLRRAGRERRLLADDGVLEHLHALAEHRPGMNDRTRVDLGAQAGAPLRTEVGRRASALT